MEQTTLGQSNGWEGKALGFAVSGSTGVIGPLLQDFSTETCFWSKL